MNPSGNHTCLVSYYSNAYDNKGTQIELSKIFDAIRRGDWESKIATIRAALANGDAEQAKTLKKDLPCFTAAGTFSKRGNKYLVRHSGLAVIDVDHLASTEEAAKQREALFDQHVVAAFISPSGGGVKVIINIGPCASAEEHRAAINALADHYSTKSGLKIVEAHGETGIDATADVARMCFVSCDPDIRVREGEAQPFTGRKWPEKPHQANSQGGTSSGGAGAPPIADIGAALYHLKPAMPYPDWARIGMAVKSAYPGDDGYRVFDEWSRRAPSDRYGGTRQLWDSLQTDGGVTVGTLFKLAEDLGWMNPAGRFAAEVRRLREEIPEGDACEPEAKQLEKPWQLVTTKEVREAIGGSLLVPMVNILQAVTVPPLPLEIVLPKALVLAGCALAQPIEFDPKTETKRGIELARVVIDTAGGQTCNVWAVIVALSGTGKDVGYLVVRIPEEMGLLLGHSGSAEGMADALVTNGGGLLTISELQNFVDPRRWEHGATSFLTQAFNGGHAKVALSKRTGGNRDIKYACPSIIASAQPAVFDNIADRLLVDSGFFPRFLISYCPDVQSWRPTAKRLDPDPLRNAFEVYRRVQTRVIVPQGYLQDVLDEFNEHGASIPSHYNRLVNEYGPRIAVMLAVAPGRPDRVEITADHWRRTGVLLRWFYGMAEGVLSRIGESAYVRKMEDRLARMLAFIKKNPKGVDRTAFARAFHRGSNSKQRDEDVEELRARGHIIILTNGRKTLFMGA